MKDDKQKDDALKTQGQYANQSEEKKKELTGRSLDLFKNTRQIETEYKDKGFYRDLSLMAKNVLAASVIAITVGLGVAAVGDKDKVVAPTPAAEMASEKVDFSSIDVSRISIIDLMNYRDKLLPYGENSVPPIDYVVNRTELDQRDQAAAHLRHLQEVKSLTERFISRLGGEDAVKAMDPIELVVAGVEFDEERATIEKLAGRPAPRYATPDEVQSFVVEMEAMGDYEFLDSRINELPLQLKNLAPTP